MRPKYSLIIPAFNSAATLSYVLPPLRELCSDWEILLVDNGSRQDPRALVAEILPRAKVLYSKNGPARARNVGAGEARGDVFVFLDSDVLVHPSVLEAMMIELEGNQELDGLFGAYATAPPEQTIISRFRNLLHRYVHQRCAGDVGSFWSGLGALNRLPFQTAQGFDATLFTQPSIEDVELGARLSSHGYRVAVAPQFTAVHLKEWSLQNMILTDVFSRAAPWTELILSGRIPQKSMNTKVEFRLGPILLVLFCFVGLWSLKGAAVTLLLYVLWSLPLVLWMGREGGLRTGLSSLPLLFCHHLCCLLGALVGLGRKLTTPRPGLDAH